MLLPIESKTALHTCLHPRRSEIVSSNPRPGLTLTLHCNWTPRVNPRRRGGPTATRSGPPWVIISLLQSLTAAAAALQPAITPRRANTCKPFHRWKLEAVGPMRDDLCTPRIAASQISHSQEHRQVFTCVSGSRRASLQVAAVVFGEDNVSLFEKPAPRSSSLSLRIFVSPHHGSGRPTKAFFCQAASLATGQEEEKELVESHCRGWKTGEKMQSRKRDGGGRAKALAFERMSRGASAATLGYGLETDLWAAAERHGSCEDPIGLDGWIDAGKLRC